MDPQACWNEIVGLMIRGYYVEPLTAIERADLAHKLYTLSQWVERGGFTPDPTGLGPERERERKKRDTPAP